MDQPLNLGDYGAWARQRWSKELSDWYNGAAADEITLAENDQAWSRLRIRPRVLVDVSVCDTSTTVLGQPYSMPIMTAPCSYNALAHPEAECAVARAAAAVGTIQILSTGSAYSLETVAKTCAAPRWYQLYSFRDRSITQDIVARAEAAGYSALCLTVDAPVDGLKERHFRNHFAVPPAGGHLPNLSPYNDKEAEAAGDYSKFELDPTLTWSGLEWFRGITRLPLVIKGILAPEDARLAIQSGAQAIVVSNHGGRQLDTSMATADALAAVAEAAGGRIEILVDGGIRRGTDVLKALALGARAVLIGRPVLWGLAADGEAGVRRVLEILRDELRNALALSGCSRLGQVSRKLIG